MNNYLRSALSTARKKFTACVPCYNILAFRTISETVYSCNLSVQSTNKSEMKNFHKQFSQISVF